MLTAYRKKVTVRPDGRIEIKDPAFKPGAKAEVIVLVEDTSDDNQESLRSVREWQAVFDATQALPQTETITEEDIAAEIAAYRAEKKHESAD